MAELNVFEMTNRELGKLTEGKKPLNKTNKKIVREATKRNKKRVPFNIPTNKLKVESLRFFEENEEEATVNYTPEDEVVLVIDPSMEETPEDIMIRFIWNVFPSLKMS